MASKNPPSTSVTPPSISVVSETGDFEYKRELAQQLVRRFGYHAARETCILNRWEGVLQAVTRADTH